MRAAPVEDDGAAEVGHGVAEGAAQGAIDGEGAAAASTAAAMVAVGGGPAESSEPMVYGSERPPGESRTPPPEAAGIPTAMARVSVDPSDSGPKVAVEGSEKPASLPDAIAPQAIRLITCIRYDTPARARAHSVQ